MEHYTYGLDEKDCFVVLIGIIAMFIVDVLHEKGKRIRKTVAAQPLPVRWICYYGMIFVIVILGVYGAGYLLRTLRCRVITGTHGAG